MTYDDIIRRLENQHRSLDAQCEALSKSGRYTDAQLTELKRKRLAIRDQLTYYRHLNYEETYQRVNLESSRS